MSNGNDAPTDTTSAARPGVTTDTAPRLAAGNPSGSTSNPSGTRSQQTDQPGDRQPGGDTRTTTTPPANGGALESARIDTAAINLELGKILEATDPDFLVRDSIPALRARAIRIYNDVAVPRALRAEAAFLASITYQAVANAEDACRWIDNALAQRPGWSSFQSTRQRLGCQ